MKRLITVWLFLSAAAGFAQTNDNFADATMLTGFPVSTSGNNSSATTELNEPYYGDYVEPRFSVWFQWAPPASGIYEVYCESSRFDYHSLAIYTGGVLSSEAQAAYNTVDGTNVLLTFSFTAGTLYHIVFDSYYETGPFSLGIRNPPPPPINDLAESALVLNGLPALGTGSNIGVTAFGDPGGKKLIWWKWTSPVDGPVMLSHVYDYDAIAFNFGIYTGSPLSTLEQVASSAFYNFTTDFIGMDPSDSVRFRAQKGETYYIGAESSQPAETGDLVFNLLALTDGCPNDAFSDALPLPSPTGCMTGSCAGATESFDDPTGMAYASTWWTWTAPYSGSFDFTLDHPSVEPIDFGIYTGTTVSGLGVIFEDAFFDIGKHRMVVTGGTDYVIGIENATDTPFTLCVSPTPPPPANDDFVHAIIIPSIPATVTGDTTGATAEPLEPSSAPGIWYTFTANTSSLAIIEGGIVFEGASLETLQEISSRNFTTMVSQTYHVRVQSSLLYEGIKEFSIRLHGLPENDDYADAEPIAGSPLKIYTDTAGATAEPGEPWPSFFGSASRTIWWAWTAPSSGSFSVDSTIGTVGVYTGATIATAIRIAEQDAFTSYLPATFNATAGSVYHIRINDFYQGESNEICIISTPLPPGNDDFSNRYFIAAAGASYTTNGNNFYATYDPNDIAILSRSLWWSWTAPNTSRTRILATGALGAKPRVYTGNSQTSLIEVTGIRLFDGLSFMASSGTTYQIVIAGAGSGFSPGEFILNIDQIDAPEFETFNQIGPLLPLSWQSYDGETYILSTSTDSVHWVNSVMVTGADGSTTLYAAPAEQKNMYRLEQP